jgi:hypothetical protein
MPRPWRIEQPGAIYHVISRGDRREVNYRQDGDGHDFLQVHFRANTCTLAFAGLGVVVGLPWRRLGKFLGQDGLHRFSQLARFNIEHAPDDIVVHAV